MFVCSILVGTYYSTELTTVNCSQIMFLSQSDCDVKKRIFHDWNNTLVTFNLSLLHKQGAKGEKGSPGPKVGELNKSVDIK